MFIQVRASNPGHAGTFTPGRFWPNGETRKLEIVRDELAERQLPPERKGAEDPAARKLKIAEGPFLPDGKPDPERITESGVAFIRGNPHLSSLGDNETQGAISQAAVDAARAAAAQANAALTDAKIYAAELEAEVEKFETANKELAQANAALTARVAELEGAAAAAEKAKAKAAAKDAKDGKDAKANDKSASDGGAT